MELIYAFSAWVVALPTELKAAIAIGVLYLVRLLLAGRVSDEWLTELAGIVTTALVAVIELALGLIPLQFEAVATAILRLIAVLLGGILVVRAYLLVRKNAWLESIRF